MVCVPLGELVVSEDSPRFEARSFSSNVEKWYKAKIKIASTEHLDEVTNWLIDNIDGYNKHADWKLTENGYLDFRFRYERHCEWFILRWY